MIIAILIALASPDSSYVHDVAAAVGNQDVNNSRFCRNQWPDDFSMRRFCEDEARKGLQKFSYFYKDSPDDLKRAMIKCFVDWHDFELDVKNWSMAGFCAKQQFDAYYQK